MSKKPITEILNDPETLDMLNRYSTVQQTINSIGPKIMQQDGQAILLWLRISNETYAIREMMEERYELANYKAWEQFKNDGDMEKFLTSLSD